MITQMRFEGYRLLDGFEADLEPLNIVIGANGTGKSTILEALSLITEACDSSLDNALSARNSLLSILSCSRNCTSIGWSLSIDRPSNNPFWSKIPIDENNNIVYEGGISVDGTGLVRVDNECLRTSLPYAGHTQPFKSLEVAGSRTLVFDPKQRRLRPFNDPQTDLSVDGSHDSDNTRASSSDLPQKAALLLSQMRFVNEFPLPTWMRAYFANLCYYPGFDVARSSPLRTKMAEIKPFTTLSPAGDNLGTVLHEILTRHQYRNSAEELRDFFRAAYPQVEDIFAETAYGGEPRVLVRIKEIGLGRPTEVWELSDGMLRFLSLCAALLNPLPPPLIAIDEPETGLHPKLLPIIADLIRSASDHSQILVTTHSPTFLDCFSLDDIVVLSRGENKTIWHRPNDRISLQKMLEANIGSTLGEMHASGELEEIP